MAGHADRAVFPELDPDATEAALVLRNGVIDRVENTHHRRRARAGLGEVEAVLETVGIVGHVDVDERGFGVDLDRRP